MAKIMAEQAKSDKYYIADTQLIQIERSLRPFPNDKVAGFTAMLLPIFFDKNHWALANMALEEKAVYFYDPIPSQQRAREAQRLCTWAEPSSTTPWPFYPLVSLSIFNILSYLLAKH